MWPTKAQNLSLDFQPFTCLDTSLVSGMWLQPTGSVPSTEVTSPPSTDVIEFFVLCTKFVVVQAGSSCLQNAKLLPTVRHKQGMMMTLTACCLFTPKVTTVDKYQGQQNDYVLLSLVRTRAVGHLRDVRRLVVAMSRARLGLYVFARTALFQDCFELGPTFSRLLKRPTQLWLAPWEVSELALRLLRSYTHIVCIYFLILFLMWLGSPWGAHKWCELM